MVYTLLKSLSIKFKTNFFGGKQNGKLRLPIL